jgi:hypothetical protein
MFGGFLFLFFAATCCGQRLIVTTQDEKSSGVVQLLDVVTGQFLLQSSLSFQFDWPLVQMTTDRENQQIYLVTYPYTASGPVLYLFDQELTLLNQWNTTSYSFFDLQYSLHQRTLYGIKVTGTYQRTLSNFILNSTNLVETELYDLPINWYVNASSYDPTTDSYYALLNHFSGMPDSTNQQQLLVSDFSSCYLVQEKQKEEKEAGEGKCQPVTRLMNISGFNGQLQFIAFSSDIQRLFVLGINLQTNDAMITLIDSITGEVRQQQVLYMIVMVTEVGPLVVHSGSKVNSNGSYIELSFFTKGTSAWTEWIVQYYPDKDAMLGSQGKVKYSSPEYKYIAAGVDGF